MIATPVGAACELLHRHGVSVVESTGGSRAECDAVVIDSERGARGGGAPLRAGHRRVALLVADTNWTSDVGRLAGYRRQAHDEAALPVDERLIVRVAFQAPDAGS